MASTGAATSGPRGFWTPNAPSPWSRESGGFATLDVPPEKRNTALEAERALQAWSARMDAGYTTLPEDKSSVPVLRIMREDGLIALGYGGQDGARIGDELLLTLPAQDAAYGLIAVKVQTVRPDFSIASVIANPRALSRLRAGDRVQVESAR